MGSNAGKSSFALKKGEDSHEVGVTCSCTKGVEYLPFMSRNVLFPLIDKEL